MTPNDNGGILPSEAPPHDRGVPFGASISHIGSSVGGIALSPDHPRKPVEPQTNAIIGATQMQLLQFRYLHVTVWDNSLRATSARRDDTGAGRSAPANADHIFSLTMLAQGRLLAQSAAEKETTI